MTYISGNFIEMLGGGVIAKSVEAVLRTGILVGVGMTGIYFSKISKEINEIIDKIVKR